MLTTEQADRARGVLLGTAVGDALGVHYEFATPPGPGQRAEMLGGGLGDFAPGEWSDDTSMAIVVARAVAARDGAAEDLLEPIALGFVEWLRSSPPDIGIQTRSVLGHVAARLDAGETGAGRIAGEEAAAYTLTVAHSAGNGALMRTAPLALAHLDDRAELAVSARRVAQLTHADPLAGDSCVLWCEAVRVAVVEGRTDVTAGLDLLGSRRSEWAAWLDDAGRGAGAFRPNGYTVTALQAAVCAIASTEEAPGQLEEALHAAVRIGDDTDTVAAIAGGLLGARWGASAVPEPWLHAVHGWPGLTGPELLELSGPTGTG